MGTSRRRTSVRMSSIALASLVRTMSMPFLRLTVRKMFAARVCNSAAALSRAGAPWLSASFRRLASATARRPTGGTTATRPPLNSIVPEDEEEDPEEETVPGDIRMKEEEPLPANWLKRSKRRETSSCSPSRNSSSPSDTMTRSG